jgi:transmembrane sensor
MTDKQTAQAIEIEAAEWIVRLDLHGRTPELEVELERWLRGDARRQGALLQVEAIWYSLDSMREAEEIPPEPQRRRGISRRWLVGAGAASLAASLAGGLIWWNVADHYSTTIGEIRRVPLADGTVIAVNTASDLSVRMGEKRREIILKTGEAWFQVAKDKSRPFLVEIGPVRAMAVGTSFSVRRREGGAEVLVSEGRVAAWVEGAEGHRVVISAGQRAFVANNAAISVARSEASEVDRALAWRGGKIDLDGDTLADAVAEFNRYNQRHIIVQDPLLAGERFYGVFRIDDPEGFAASVQSILEAPVDVSSPAEIRIGKPTA